MMPSRDAVAARHEVLLEVVESIRQHRDIRSLVTRLGVVLRRVVSFDQMAIAAYDDTRATITLFIADALESVPSPVEVALQDAAGEWEDLRQRPLVVSDIALVEHLPRSAAHLQARGFRSALLLPLTTAVRNVGVLVFGAGGVGAYRETDIAALVPVADQVATAVDNALHSEQARKQQVALTREHDRSRVLLDVTNALVSTLDLDELLRKIAPSLTPVVEFDVATIDLYDVERQVLQPIALYPASGPVTKPNEPVPIGDSPLGRAFASGEPLLIDEFTPALLGPAVARVGRRAGLQSGCAIPLLGPRRTVGAFMLASRQPRGFAAGQLDLLLQVGRQIAIAIENAVAYQRIAELTERLAGEKRYLEDEIRGAWAFEEIVGRSAPIRQALSQVEDVAPTDTTVLLLGETGTGKELFARAIHRLSPRRDRTLVKVNCAAIPSGLLESELFGHEKGAFTGALERKIGRFELADHGTLLLDEIGDIPLELQTKLCASFRNASSSGWAAPAARGSMSASSPRPTRTSSGWSPRTSSGPTCTIG